MFWSPGAPMPLTLRVIGLMSSMLSLEPPPPPPSIRPQLVADSTRLTAPATAAILTLFTFELL